MILSKVNFSGFGWLNLENLSSSNGYKFELYAKGDDVTLSDYIILFYSLFGDFKNEVIVGQMSEEGNWGDFCLDTWNFETNESDYSTNGKSINSQNYLSVLLDSKIEPEYNGFCKCQSWDQFLPIILKCLISGEAPYSVICYIKNTNVVFYFHQTLSFGIYFRELNSTVESIIRKAKLEELTVKYSTHKSI